MYKLYIYIKHEKINNVILTALANSNLIENNIVYSITILMKQIIFY